MSDSSTPFWLNVLGAFALSATHPAAVSFWRYTMRTISNDLVPSKIVSDILVYPVKSCRPISPKEWPYSSHGFLYDREWMFMDPAAQKFITQRDYACLSLIQVDLVGRHHDKTDINPTHLRFSVAGQPDYPPCLHKIRNRRRCAEYEKIKVAVWKDECVAYDEGDDISEWITAYVHANALKSEFQPPETIRLVRMDPNFTRQTDMQYSVEGDNTKFADGFPFLVVSQSSLSELNSRLEQSGAPPVPMDRFRPNIVVAGGHAFQEDTWRRVEIGFDTFRFAKPCSRCKMTTIEQDTAQVTAPNILLGHKRAEPLHTLSQFRMDTKQKIYFGMNVIPDRRCNGVLRVGEEVKVLE